VLKPEYVTDFLSNDAGDGVATVGVVFALWNDARGLNIGMGWRRLADFCRRFPFF
jgi:hypothetical protein